VARSTQTFDAFLICNVGDGVNNAYKNIAIRTTDDGTRFAMEISVFQQLDGNETFSFDAQTERQLPLTLSDARSWIEALGDAMPAAFKDKLLQQLISSEEHKASP